MARFAVGLFFCLLAGSIAFSQTDPAAGLQPFGTTVGGQVDHLDLATGNIFISIPVRNKIGAIPFSYALVSNSHAYASNFSWQVSHGFAGSQTGLLGTRLTYQQVDSQPDCHDTHQQDPIYGNFVVIDSSGASHPVDYTAMTDKDLCNTLPQGVVTVDGSGYTLNFTGWNTADIYDKSGDKVSGVALYDPDGNSINGSTDTLNTTALTVTLGSYGSGQPDKYQYNDSGGNPQTVQVNYTQYTQQTNFGCSGGIPYELGPTSVYLPSSITLPTGGQYTISYETTPNDTHNPHYVTGRLAKLTLPSGGYVSYGYSGGNHGVNCTSLVVPTITRTVSDNNGNSGTWTYVNTNNLSNNFTVTETTPPRPGNSTGDTITHYFSGEYETQRIVQDVNLGVLSTTTTCYGSKGATPPTPPNCVTLSTVPTLPITETDVYTSLNTSATNRVKTTFDSTYGNVTSVIAYDFGASTPTTQTFMSYGQSWNGTACTAYPSGTNINTTPCYSHTENSSGTDVAKTKITFSNTGHPTSTARWVSGSAWLTSTASYNSNGTIAWSKDPANNQTTFAYNGSGGCNNLLVTSTTYAVSAVGSDAQTWNCNGGVQASYQDVNSNTTSYTYADPLWRLTEVQRPDGGTTTVSYSTGSSSPWSVSTTTLVSSGNSTTTTNTLDGLGRTVQSTTTDPNNTSTGEHYVNTVYDSLGHVYSVTNPFFTTGDATYGLTSYSYDALGRTTQITNPDNTYRTFSFTNRATEFTDESGIQRVYQSDGLGRLVSVCDGVGAGTQANNVSASACGQDISANGFLATYNYDALGNLTTMNFSGQGRQFAYDGLSRMVIENVPEIPGVSCGGGTYSKCYTYDSGTAGDLYSVTFLNPSGTSVNAIYSWDALHRLSTLEYSDSSNGYGYGYDASTWLTWNLTNGKGRLTAQSHSNGAAAAYSYDSMGRAVWEGSCAGSNCYGTVRGINHGYDYSGDVTGITTTYTGGVTYTHNSIGQLTGVTSTWHDTTHPSPLLSGVTYNALGEVVTATYGDNVVRTNSYDTLGRVTVIQDGSAPTYRVYLHYNPNSTIYSYQDNVTGRWNYTYDAFNRLATAVLTQTGNLNAPSYSYSYDQYGNRWKQHLVSGTGNEVDYTFEGHNRNNSFSYDYMGNVIADGVICTSACWSYDYAGQLTAGDGASYLYDGLGRRQQKTDAGGTVHGFVFDGNQPYTEFTPGFTRQTGGFYTYANGTTYFNRADNLTMPRLSTDYNGTVQRKEGVLMGPFGDNFTETLSTLDFTGFAGGFWDSENNGEHFGAREYQNTHGSWLSPDPAGLAAVDITNPQTWNRYAYVMDNPTSYVDPLGLYYACVKTGDDPAICTWYPDDPPPQYGGDVTLVSFCDINPGAPACRTLPDRAANNGFTFGIRAPGQTWSQCMAANANTYSIGGATELTVNVATGTNSNISQTTSIVTGNGITGLIFEGPGAGDFLSAAGSGAGSALSYGRRTSNIMSLNLAGSGGLPQALGSTGAQGFFQTAGKWLNLGLDEAEKFAVDAGLAGAEAFNCAIHR